MAIAQRRLSLEEFLGLPEQKPALEYLGGVVRQKMSPQGPHSGLQGDLYLRFELLRSGTPRGAGVSGAADDARRRLGRARHLRLPLGSGPIGRTGQRSRGCPGAAGHRGRGHLAGPDAQRARGSLPLVRRARRAGGLARHPRRRTVRVLRAGSEPRSFSGSERVDLGDALPGFELVVDDLFRALRARPD